MSRLTEQEARDLAAHVVAITQADQAEVVVFSHESSLTRFAANRIHQNVVEADTGVSVRAVLGTRAGVASTNRLDGEALAQCCAVAVAAASSAPEDPEFPGLPSPRPVETPERASAAVERFTPERRAETVRAIVSQSTRESLSAAGSVASGLEVVAVANSLGIGVAMAITSMRATVLSMAESGSGGAGWASYYGADQTGLAPEALGEQAATLALRSRDPADLDPGEYTVVLAPEAVADILGFLGRLGFSARSVAEGRSFMSNRLGERIASEAITITDDALAPESFGLTFDFEGYPKRQVSLIEKGVAIGPVTDSYWAAKSERENTGHALPAPNPHGPMPLDLRMEPGDETMQELVASVERGVYVTRFHYTNVEDPVPVTLTGMTRDGTFLIENGAVTKPLRNQRFTQSAVAALDAVAGVTRERAFFKTMIGAVLVPGLLVEGWGFTGQTT